MNTPFFRSYHLKKVFFYCYGTFSSVTINEYLPLGMTLVVLKKKFLVLSSLFAPTTISHLISHFISHLISQFIFPLISSLNLSNLSTHLSSHLPSHLIYLISFLISSLFSTLVSSQYSLIPAYLVS